MPDHDELDRFVNNEIDLCYECRINGDDYYVDSNGDMIDNCYSCPLNSFGFCREDDDI